MNGTEQVVPIRQTTRRGDRRLLVEDPDAAAGRDNGSAQPQTVKRPVLVPQEMVQVIVFEDETLQPDAETVEKVTINEAYT